MKIALVCDWLTNVGGAERVLKTLSDMFPSAPIYTSQYNPKKIDWFKNRDVRVGWLQVFPTSFRRLLGPLRQGYFSHLDLSNYDLIISVTGAEAKSIKKGNARHVCFCHVPTQYYWGMKDEYLKNPGFGILNPFVRFGLKLFLPQLRKADYRAAQKPDEFITISTYAAGEIRRAYDRESTVIFPPVAVEKFSTTKFSTSKKKTKTGKSQPNISSKTERGGYVVTSRQVNWKRLDLAVKTCLALKLPLTVIGEGPEHNHLKKIAKKSNFIKFVPLVSQDELITYLRSAKGYIFPSLEPFGIAPVEALAAGCPVIAYGNGGALDYVIDGENGVLFGKQSVNSLRQALKRFETLSFDETKISSSALPFSEARFREKILEYISSKSHNHSTTAETLNITMSSELFDSSETPDLSNASNIATDPSSSSNSKSTSTPPKSLNISISSDSSEESTSPTSSDSKASDHPITQSSETISKTTKPVKVKSKGNIKHEKVNETGKSQTEKNAVSSRGYANKSQPKEKSKARSIPIQ